jgi:FixJ family two-component response regulator
VASIPVVSVVDDDESVRAALRGLIRSVGMRVETFASAEEFLFAEPAPHADCLIVDVRMPGMSGLELQRELVANRRAIPLIFITAHATDAAARARALRDGAVAYLIKPFSEDALLKAVNAALKA